MTLGSTNFCNLAGDFRCVKYQYSFYFFLFLFSILFQEKKSERSIIQKKRAVFSNLLQISRSRGKPKLFACIVEDH